LTRLTIRLLYRAAVLSLMMPHFAERSISEKVAGRMDSAALASFLAIARRISRTWWRKRVFRKRFTTVFRFVIRTRFKAETVFAIG